jgi:hypothetical protein
MSSMGESSSNRAIRGVTRRFAGAFAASLTVLGFLSSDSAIHERLVKGQETSDGPAVPRSSPILAVNRTRLAVVENIRNPFVHYSINNEIKLGSGVLRHALKGLSQDEIGARRQ